jgi:hypothetical protein
MWFAPERGKLEGTIEQLCYLIKCDVDTIAKSIKELDILKIANVTCHGDVTNCHTNITIINRRMYNDSKLKENARLRKRKEREIKSCHKDVTTHSPSLPLSPSKKKGIKKKVLSDPGYTETFLKFWEVYPRKTKKVDAFESWSTLDPEEELSRKIKDAVISQIKAGMLNIDDLKYCAHPSTWLNGRRWEDEINKKPEKEVHNGGCERW